MAAVSDYFGLSIGQFWTYAEKLATQMSPRRT